MDTNQQSREPAEDIGVVDKPAEEQSRVAGGNGAQPALPEPQPPQAEAPDSGADEQAPAEEKAQPSLLYVEDDMLSREVMRLLLQKELGYTRLTIISDNHDFMDKVRALPGVPDVIFLDIQMRPHDGYEMLSMLRAEEAYRKCQIIAMTASVMATDVEALKKAGFSGLIGKPIMRHAFPEQFEQILAGKTVWFVS